MDMDSAAIFLAGSVLYALGCIVILIAVVVANNIIHKYWKSFGWKFISDWLHPVPSAPVRFAEPHELDKLNEPKVK